MGLPTIARLIITSLFKWRRFDAYLFATSYLVTKAGNPITDPVLQFPSIMRYDHRASGHRDDHIADSSQPVQGSFNLYGTRGAVHAFDTETNFDGMWRVGHDSGLL
ncbi:MAG: hypothetical protein C207_04611 (plasmid) [Bradyrhizobium sp. DFCI-1]|nr:MAG: hypothetical protein C207_04611 [Bradyrhizobium sp. DFCI-1]